MEAAGLVCCFAAENDTVTKSNHSQGVFQYEDSYKLFNMDALLLLASE